MTVSFMILLSIAVAAIGIRGFALRPNVLSVVFWLAGAAIASLLVAYALAGPWAAFYAYLASGLYAGLVLWAAAPTEAPRLVPISEAVYLPHYSVVLSPDDTQVLTMPELVQLVKEAQELDSDDEPTVDQRAPRPPRT